MKTVRKKAGMNDAVSDTIWKNNASGLSINKYKEKIGNEPPKTLKEANNELDVICSDATKKAIAKYKKESEREGYKNVKTQSIYDHMTDNQKYVVDYIYSNFNVKGTKLINYDNTPKEIKDKFRNYYKLNFNEQKELAVGLINQGLDSSGIFNDENKKPKVVFSNKTSNFGYFDFGRNIISINPDYFDDTDKGTPYVLLNTIGEEVSHAVMYHYPLDNLDKEDKERMKYFKNALCVYGKETYDKNPNEINAKWNAKDNDDKLQANKRNSLQKIESVGRYISTTFTRDIPNLFKLITSH